MTVHFMPRKTEPKAMTVADVEPHQWFLFPDSEDAYCRLGPSDAVTICNGRPVAEDSITCVCV